MVGCRDVRSIEGRWNNEIVKVHCVNFHRVILVGSHGIFLGILPTDNVDQYRVKKSGVHGMTPDAIDMAWKRTLPAASPSPHSPSPPVPFSGSHASYAMLNSPCAPGSVTGTLCDCRVSISGWREGPFSAFPPYFPCFLERRHLPSLERLPRGEALREKCWYERTAPACRRRGKRGLECDTFIVVAARLVEARQVLDLIGRPFSRDGRTVSTIAVEGVFLVTANVLEGNQASKLGES